MSAGFKVNGAVSRHRRANPFLISRTLRVNASPSIYAFNAESNGIHFQKGPGESFVPRSRLTHLRRFALVLLLLVPFTAS
jgi:hypothetical protein